MSTALKGLYIIHIILQSILQSIEIT